MNKDYREYHFSKREGIRYVTEGMILNGILSALFYNSWIAMIPGIGLVIIYLQEIKKERIRKRLYQMRMQFKEFLENFCAALQTGRSVENAFSEAVRDLRQYSGKETELIMEFQSVAASVAMNGKLEVLLLEAARRCCMEELEYFVQVFSIAKRSGGNLIATMRYTSRTLQDRMDIENEIYTVIYQKRLEFYIMSVIPMFMICYFRLSMPGLMEGLYGNVKGVLIMTGCLLAYGGCFLYGRRILEFEG